MKPERIDAEIEALLILATEPLSEMELAETLDASIDEVTYALKRLAGFYDETGRGFELRHVGMGWRYYTRPEHAETIARSVLEGRHGRLTQASLETLAVIAYFQPISRGRIASVRGVNVDGVVRTLLARNLIVERDREETNGVGLLCTTDYFLERMGLTSLADLPALAPHLPDASQLDEELRRLATEGLTPERAEPDSEVLDDDE